MHYCKHLCLTSFTVCNLKLKQIPRCSLLKFNLWKAGEIDICEAKEMKCWLAVTSAGNSLNLISDEESILILYLSDYRRKGKRERS